MSTPFIVDIPAELYDDFRRGVVTEEELEQTEELWMGLKTASFSDFAQKAMGSEAGRTALLGLAGGVGAGGAGLIGLGAGKALKKGWDKLTYGRDMNRILEVYPHLKEYPERERHLAYDSLRHLNPHFAKDPLVGGTMLGQILRSRDPTNPKSLRFEGHLAADLVKSRVRDDDPVSSGLQNAFQQGMRDAMQESAKGRAYQQQLADRRQDSATDRAFREQQDAGRRAFDLQKAKDDRAHKEQLEQTKADRMMVQKALEKELEWFGPRGQEEVANPDYHPLNNPDVPERIIRPTNETITSRPSLRHHLKSKWGVDVA